MRLLAWDLELTPMNVWSWSLWPDAIPIQAIKEPQHILCFGARWYGSKNVIFKSVYHDGLEDTLNTIHRLLDEADATISWNGAAFDSKHIRREFKLAGMDPPSPWKEIDLLRTARSQFKFASTKLDHVAQQLGVGAKTQHSGFKLWLDCMGENGEEAQAKAWPLMRRYQKQDVNLLIDLYDEMLPWIPNHPNVALHNDVPNGCKQCGSTHLQRRGYVFKTARKYQRYQCQDCGTWQPGSKSLPALQMLE